MRGKGKWKQTFRRLVCVLLFALGPLCFGKVVTVRIITDKKIPGAQPERRSSAANAKIGVDEPGDSSSRLHYNGERQANFSVLQSTR
jgi:hypothetical protein